MSTYLAKRGGPKPGRLLTILGVLLIAAGLTGYLLTL